MNNALKIGLAGVVIAASAAAPFVAQRQARIELRARQVAFEQQASRLSLLAEANGRLSNLVAQANASASLTEDQLRELLRLRNEKHWLAEQTNRLARLAAGTLDQVQASQAGSETGLRAEMTEALKQILPALQPALQKYALVHSNQPPGSFSELQDCFPLVDGRKMAGLQTFEFARGRPRDQATPCFCAEMRVAGPGMAVKCGFMGSAAGASWKWPPRMAALTVGKRST